MSVDVVKVAGPTIFSGATGSIYERFDVVNTPAKFLIRDEFGDSIPCKFQYWVKGDSRGCSRSGNYYVPAGIRIDVGYLVAYKQIIYRSTVREGEDFDKFVRNLMLNPTGAKLIRYDGVVEVEIPRQPRRILYVAELKRKPKKIFIHRFSLCYEVC